MATRTVKAAGGNSNVAGTYVENALVTSADDVVCDGTAGNYVIAATLQCKSINFTGYTNTLSGSAAIVCGGNMTFGAGMIRTYTGAISCLHTASSPASRTLTFNGITFATTWNWNVTTDTLLLADNLVTTGTFTFNSGTINLQNHNITALSIALIGGTVTLGSSTLTGTGTGTVISYVGGVGFNFGTSTFVINDATATTKTVSGGIPFYNLHFVSGGSGALTFDAGCTFNGTLTVDPGMTIKLAGGVTTTFSTIGPAWAGTAGNVVTLDSVSGTATISYGGVGTLTYDYMTVKNSAGDPALTWIGDTHTTDGGGNSGWTFLGGSVAPTITSASSDTIQAGSPMTPFTVTATGTPTPSYSESGTLPSNLSLNGSSGVLSGTAALGTGGVYSLSFFASNGVAPDATQSFTLTNNEAPTITSANSTTFTVGSTGHFTTTATGYPVPSWSESGTLPSGVTFNTGTHSLDGSPASGTGAAYSITIIAGNSSGATTQSFTLTVTQAPVITSASSATFITGDSGNFTVTSTGYPTPSYTETGTLPSGITLNSGSGVLGGTSTDIGTFPLTIVADNGVGSASTQSFTLRVASTGPPAGSRILLGVGR